MFAVVEIAGFQEIAREGDKICVPLLDAKTGDKVTFDRVLLVSKDGAVTIGTPVVAGASVEVAVVRHGRGDKITVVKFRRRKRHLRTRGHRQGYTEIQVTKVHA